MKTSAYFCILVLLLAVLTSSAQKNTGEATSDGQKKSEPLFKKLDHISLSFSNSHTAMPYGSFSKLFYKEFHPGLEVGTGLNWKTAKKHDWIQTVNLQYSYHRFIQHTLMLYTEGGYRYKIIKGLDLTGKLGVGYMLAIEDSKVFELNDKGEYEEINNGRSHLMGALSFQVDKLVGKKGWLVFFNYQQRFQFRFIDDYVPVLPVNAASLGFSFPINKK
ncbi:MAG: hypothetical protein ACXWV9_03650 [Flavisolibacter sp.]